MTDPILYDRHPDTYRHWSLKVAGPVATLTLTIDEVNPASVGGLIALFERTVGLYASLVGINAYHQPGVEAGKKAATAVLAVRKSVKAHLRDNSGQAFDASALAVAIGHADKTDWVFGILQSLTANEPKVYARESAAHPLEDRFFKV